MLSDESEEIKSFVESHVDVVEWTPVHYSFDEPFDVVVYFDTKTKPAPSIMTLVALKYRILELIEHYDEQGHLV